MKIRLTIQIFGLEFIFSVGPKRKVAARRAAYPRIQLPQFEER